MSGGKVQQAPRTGAPPVREVRVWDRLVRLFHWSLVACFALAYAAAEDWRALHEYAGYGVVCLVGGRLLWGLFGSRHARFAEFVRGPRAVLAYLAQTLRGRAPRYLGHNPAGGAMVVALMVMLAVIGGSGWLMTTDAYWGVEWPETVHETAVTLTLVMVGIHLLGVVVASLEHRENLVRAMITGRKRAE